MNFFEQQDRAKRSSSYLLLLFLLAVCSLIALTTLAVTLALPFISGGADAPLRADVPLVGAIALVVTAVVLLGSLYKSRQLRTGGRVVAELLGGRLLNLGPQDADEKKIVNVVEEMAIASGTPVPPVYLLEDEAINAFAAGLTPQDAVIGITRGCIRQLSRDELQGVVAHEFSHIFHGDMRLNTRLVALLHGILVIGLIGEMVLRGASQRSSGSSSSSSKKDNSALVFLALGAGLMLIGYAGTFFGNWIKAAVSRQREFLADASAVRFTRNPDGIAGALKKIGAHAAGSELQAVQAAQFSHMFFGQGIAVTFGSMAATHPPLEERIRRVDPGWDGQFVPDGRTVAPPARVAPAGPAQALDETLGGLIGAGLAALTHTPYQTAERPPASTRQGALDAIEAIGTPGHAHLQHARQVLDGLDEVLSDAARSPFSARALAYGLLLSRDPDVRDRQLALLREQAADAFVALDGLLERLLRLLATQRLPLIDLVLPALKQLSVAQHDQFIAGLVALIRADREISLMEWALYRILLHNLRDPQPTTARFELQQLPGETALLVSALAYAGHASDEQADAAFLVAASQLPFAALQLVAVTTLSIAALDKALDKLSQLKPLHKPRLLKALARCIEHDQQIRVDEAELFRAIADSLDCPMPPLLLSPQHPSTHYQPVTVPS
ncbi:MAG: M48 family metallopeptidase [Pseudomonas sp.]|uniref:M48 family metallopeptidase n=1 Tax=Pseudomonas sp. TaxID=306 RepID=UPI003399D49B